MAEALVVVTGHREIDAKLREMPPAMQRKFIRGALRLGSKRLLREFRRIVRSEAFDTGAYMRAASVRSLKRSRKRIGIGLHVDRNKLFAVQKKKAGRADEYYYPASLEFGYVRKDGTQVEGIRAQRRALYDNQGVYRDYFVGDLRKFIAEQRVTTTLPKVTGFGKL